MDHDTPRQPADPTPDDPTPGDPPPALRLRGPEDLLAAVPVLLGFEPADSLVLLTQPRRPGGGRTPHVRVDLPAGAHVPAGVLVDLVEAVVAPCAAHDVGQVLVVHYTGDGHLARRTTAVLHEALDELDVEVLGVVHTDGARWRQLGTETLMARSAVARSGVHQPSSHVIRAEAVLRGQVVHGSREQLARTLAASEGSAADAVRSAVRDERRRAHRRVGPAEAQWVATTVPALVREVATRGPGGGADLAPAVVARLLLALEVGTNRDAAWRDLARPDAASHHALWAELTRLAPIGLRAAPAALAALTAWLQGHGALAWCGVDVCLDETPRHGLGCLVRDLLASATAPTWWDEVGPAVHGDPA